MRTRFMILTAAVVLASSSLPMAQTAAKQPGTPAAQTIGTIDFGARLTSTEGDAARYERYRDLRTGGNLNLTLSREGGNYQFDLAATNVGYRDSHYVVGYRNGRVKVGFLYDRLPLNYSYETKTPWIVAAPGVLSLDSNVRTAVQNRTLPSTVTGIPSSAATAALPSIYRDLANPFDLRQQRDSIGLNIEFEATDHVTAFAKVNSYKRTGFQPWGASFAFNNANEVPLQLDNRTTDVSTAVEWASTKGSFKLGYDGSFFQQNIPFLIWDNPLRATDFDCRSALFLPSNYTCSSTAPWYGSAYSDGNYGAARGRMSLSPSNHVNAVNAVAMYKLPAHSSLNGTFGVTRFTQNAYIADFTMNQVIAPVMPNLERQTTEGDVLYTNAMVNFTSRPARYVGINAKYRYSNRSDRTPIWEISGPGDGINDNVRFDGVPEDVGGETEHLNIKRDTFDASVSLTPIPFTAIRVGYGYDRFDRTGRAFSSMADNSFRVSVDSVGNQYLALRAIYERTSRKGSGFSEDAIEEGGAQGDLRFYDEADRTRDRYSLVFDVTPLASVGLNFSAGRTKDEYSGPGHEFGLLSNDGKFFTVGVDFVPMDKVAFGINYGWEKYSSFQASRNANPPQDLTAIPPVAASDYGSWFDPNRNWNITIPEKIKNVSVYVDLLKVTKNTDIRFGYDYSDSDQAFNHGGQRVADMASGVASTTAANIVYPGFSIPAPCSPAGSKCFIPLSNVTNKWNRATVDVRYTFTSKVGIGLGYWYEKFDVSDWAAINLAGTDLPRIDYLGGISTGYSNRPYKGSTAHFRVFYLF